MLRGLGIRKKMTLMVLTALIPLLAIAAYLLFSLVRYSGAYDEIVSNMTIANSYNLQFREEMDERLYKLVVRGLPFEKAMGHGSAGGEREETLADPYELINELREDFSKLEGITTDAKSRQWLRTLLRNIDTLEDRVDDIRDSLAEGDNYDENIRMLDDNIYILTELIQDNIQYYIYYQTQSIETLKEKLNQAIRTFSIFAIVLIIAALSATSAISTVTIRAVTAPVEDLVDVTGKIAQGNLEARAGVHGNDEITKLSCAVNDMAQNLEVMVSQIKEDEHKMRWQELRLLQEQINPHFLYNALDTIVWLIEGRKNDEAEDMVMSLSTFFKLVLSHGKEFITIREEEQHIRSYLEIQQVRYRDILTYSIDIDPAIYEYRILKMTLQPLVENALYHGIKYKRAMGNLDITGRMDADGSILLKVEDDGVGMEQDELDKLRQAIEQPCSETDTGFGMANVNERIHMNFGREYGLRVNSKAGEGTVVEIRLPAETNAEQTEAEQV